jgi:hypothetical protein
MLTFVDTMCEKTKSRGRAHKSVDDTEAEGFMIAPMYTESKYSLAAEKSEIERHFPNWLGYGQLTVKMMLSCFNDNEVEQLHKVSTATYCKTPLYFDGATHQTH